MEIKPVVVLEVLNDLGLASLEELNCLLVVVVQNKMIEQEV